MTIGTTLAIMAAAPFALAPLPASELAEMRGGFALPGGLNVAMTIQTDTRVDGSLLLRTVYRIEEAKPQLAVFAPDGVSGERPLAGTAAAASAPASNLTVTFDRQNGARIGPSAVPASAITIMSAKQGSIGNGPDDIKPVNFEGSNGTVVVPTGTLVLTDSPVARQVQLQTDQLDVSHLFGNTIGSVIANSGNDRAIDSATTIGLDISGATQFNLGSSMLKIDTLVSQSAAQLLPR